MRTLALKATNWPKVRGYYTVLYYALGCEYLRETHRIIHSQERRFQDGTVRFLYNDGMQKTIYKSGRIRVKDKDGKLLMDSAACERRQ